MSCHTLNDLEKELRLTLRPYNPRFGSDTNDRDQAMLTVRVDDPTVVGQSLSLEVTDTRGSLTGTLWLGAVRITDNLTADMCAPAVLSVLNGEIVTVCRYRNADDRDFRRPADVGSQVFQITPDADGAAEQGRLDACLCALKKPVGLLDRISGKRIGLFEVCRWGVPTEVIERK